MLAKQGIDHTNSEPADADIQAWINDHPEVEEKYRSPTVLRTTVWSVMRNKKLTERRRAFAQYLMQQHGVVVLPELVKEAPAFGTN